MRSVPKRKRKVQKRVGAKMCSESSESNYPLVKKLLREQHEKYANRKLDPSVTNYYEIRLLGEGFSEMQPDRSIRRGWIYKGRKYYDIPIFKTK